MADCQIVLRFFALRDLDAIKGAMRSILDKCMEARLHPVPVDVAGLKVEFLDRLDFANKLFDGRPFRLSQKEAERPSVSMFDAVMVALDRNWAHREKVFVSKDKIHSAYWAALDTSAKMAKFTGRANTSNDVRARIGAMEKVIQSVL